MFLFYFKIFLLINITYALATGDKQGGISIAPLFSNNFFITLFSNPTIQIFPDNTIFFGI